MPSFNPLNAELNPIRHLLALVGARHIVHVSRIRVKTRTVHCLVSMPYSGAGCVAAVERRTRNLRLLEGCDKQKESSVSFVCFVSKFLQIMT